MADVSRDGGPSVDAMAFDLLADAFLDVTGVLTRTVPDLWAAIRHAVTRFTAQECRNCLAAAGYEDDVAVAT